MSRPNQPTGLSTEASGNSIKISWIANLEPDIKGYNIYNSTTSGGGVSGYAKLNSELITLISEVKQQVISSNTTVQIIGGQRTTTTVDDIQNVTMYAFDHTDLLEDRIQYYVVTAVNNSGVESLYSIEINDVPLIITTDIVQYPIRSSSDVVLSMINRSLDRYPDIDIKPGTMTRDIHIDPHAAEFGNLYTYIDFLVKSQSFLTLLDIDDPNNTGTSIAVSDSAYKQSLKAALQLTNDSDVQNIIDFAFDNLAANYKSFRLPATPSICEAVFYTPIKPLATITIPQNTIVSTTATSVKPAINFQTMAEAVILIGSVSQYFNTATQRYEVTVPIQSMETGLITKVGSGTIINSTFSQLQVTNVKPAEDGQDQESNRKFADRTMLAFTSLDVGTIDGYLRTCIEAQFVDDVLIVDAGHVLMQRDFDDVRKKHVYGKVDIYFKGSSEISYTETFGFLFNGAHNEAVQVLTALDLYNYQVQVLNPDVSLTYPLYLIEDIENLTQTASYDLTGNFTVYKNAIELPKSQYSLDRSTATITLDTELNLGDNLTADYQYKVTVSNELVLTSTGTESFAYLSQPYLFSKSVAIFSESVYINRTSDFTVDILTNILTVYPIGENQIYHTADVVQLNVTTNIGDHLPTPLVAGVDYYVIKVNSVVPPNNQIKLASTAANAIAGISINVLDIGQGQLTIFPSTKVKLTRNTDYTLDNQSGLITFSIGGGIAQNLVSGDVISADYDYIESIVGEVVIASASGGETSATLSNTDVLESVVIEPDGITIAINNSNVINAAIGLAALDNVTASYRYLKASPIVLQNQPANSIVSVTTSLGDVLQPQVNYTFDNLDDVLLEGNSINAQRSITMKYDPITDLPHGSVVDFSENVSLPATEPQILSKKGIDDNTIIVKNLTGSITYDVNVDYIIEPASSSFTNATIARTNSSAITSGQTVTVSYKYGEQITVVYTVNSLVNTLQNKVDVKRCVTADVLVKEANIIDVDLEFTVKLKTGANAAVIKDQLSTSLFSTFDQKKLGDRINQSDVISIIDDTVGVDYVILPLTKMAISDNVLIVNEAISRSLIWSQIGITTAYKTPVDTLNYHTAGSSSDSSLFWRVSEDDIALTLVSSYADVSLGLGRAFIASDRSVYVSTREGDSPINHAITVAYNVFGETGANDIVTADLNYVSLKSLIINVI